MQLFLAAISVGGLHRLDEFIFLEIGKGCRFKVRDQPRWTKLHGGRNCNRVPYNIWVKRMHFKALLNS